MFKPFFVHYNRLVTKHDNSALRYAPRGFTAEVTPDPKNERNAFVRVTFCSSKDEFIKANGRKFVESAPVEVFNKRDLPGVMASCANACRYDQEHTEAHYMYLLKYVV